MKNSAKRPHPVFDHLDRLSDHRGLFEHALLETPRREHGYCVDDTARGLVIACREPNPDRVVRRLAQCYLDFVLAALGPDGACRNRMDADGNWRDEPGLGDWWGRAVWGLGVAAVHARTPEQRDQALTGFRLAARQRSPFSRAMAFAALGAGELLRARGGERVARDLLRDAAAAVDTPGSARDWPWPEARLRYANGAVPEALLVAGEALPDPARLARGLELLAFLVRIETRDGKLSLTPAGGRRESDAGPGFDQQPIEAAALADACATAYRITADPRWLPAISRAWRWFLGDNDSSTPMFDPVTGAGYDGLEPGGHNLNRGAESTLAQLSTAQQARRVHELR